MPSPDSATVKRAGRGGSISAISSAGFGLGDGSKPGGGALLESCGGAGSTGISGTCGTGYILELGTERDRWLLPGDVLEMEIKRVGMLRNTLTDSAGKGQ